MKKAQSDRIPRKVFWVRAVLCVSFRRMPSYRVFRSLFGAFLLSSVLQSTAAWAHSNLPETLAKTLPETLEKSEQNFTPPNVEIKSVTKMIPMLRQEFQDLMAGDLVVFDLDNTIFREAQMLGTDEWYSHVMDSHELRGSPQFHEVMKPLNLAIKSKTKMRLMESSLPRLIRHLQARGVYVIGLTARHPELAESTLRLLAEKEILFGDSHLPFFPPEGYKVPGVDVAKAFSYEGGVAFTDGSPKGTVMREILKSSGIRPGTVIAADDRIGHVRNFVEALQEMGLRGLVIHYLRYQELEAFDPVIADIQLERFNESGRFLSDRQARRLLKQKDCVQALEL